jgi:transposase
MEEKFYVVELKAAGKSNHQIASETGFPRSTVIRMLESEEKIRTAINEGKPIETKRLRLQKFPQLEQKLMEWYRTMRKRTPITSDLLQVSF